MERVRPREFWRHAMPAAGASLAAASPTGASLTGAVLAAALVTLAWLTAHRLDHRRAGREHGQQGQQAEHVEIGHGGVVAFPDGAGTPYPPIAMADN